MPLVHDPAFRSSLRSRLQSLRPDTERRWGTMTVGQMLWHCGDGLELALGTRQLPRAKGPMPAPIMKAMVLYGPWPKGAPTMPQMVPTQDHDFETERARCLQLLDAVSTRRIDDPWPTHPLLGSMTGRAWSRLQARHLDHHLKQFGS